jgi:ATP-dependent DNA ligase
MKSYCAAGVANSTAELYAFDLLELDAKDLRSEPIERRKDAFHQLLGKGRPGVLTIQRIDVAATIFAS